MRIGETRYSTGGEIEFAQYLDGSVCIMLHDGSDGTYLRLTVNLPEHKLAKDCVWIKNWSENEGAWDALVKAGVGTATGRSVMTGFATAHEMKLSDAAIKQRDEAFAKADAANK